MSGVQIFRPAGNFRPKWASSSGCNSSPRVCNISTWVCNSSLCVCSISPPVCNSILRMCNITTGVCTTEHVCAISARGCDSSLRIPGHCLGGGTHPTAQTPAQAPRQAQGVLVPTRRPQPSPARALQQHEEGSGHGPGLAVGSQQFRGCGWRGEHTPRNPSPCAA